MNEAALETSGQTAKPQGNSAHSTGGSTIRRQLIWASLFPLAFFSLLASLVTAVALHEMTLSLALQRNTAQAQAAASHMSEILAGQPVPVDQALAATLRHLQPGVDSLLLLVSEDGRVMSATGSPDRYYATDKNLQKIIIKRQPHSMLMTSPVTEDQEIVSYAPLNGSGQGLVLVEPWEKIMTPAFYYQLVLVGLLTLGTALSLGMLSLSLGRVIQPITNLARSATQTVPGSIFHPLPEQGPEELRALTASFNQMVIRLAEQQSSLRQYSQKALISQEEERQRLSHELHDGTVQDLVGLVQRLELCRAELERDPDLARRRLDELKMLSEQTLNDVRRISNALRPSILQDLGLPVALQALCDDLEQQMPGIHCTCVVSGDPRRLAPEMELAVFRVAQEALTNVRKHAINAERVAVNLVFQEAEVQITIQDSGPGFATPDVRTLVRGGHLGLAGMYERARLFGGSLDIKPIPGEGTVVILQLPL